MTHPYIIFPKKKTLTVRFNPGSYTEQEILTKHLPIKLNGETYVDEKWDGHYYLPCVVIEPNIEFVEDARDRVAYPTTGVPETTEEMKHIIALGEHANIYIKDYTITVDHESHTATIEFEEVVEGNPLMGEGERDTTTVNLHFVVDEGLSEINDLNQWRGYPYYSRGAYYEPPKKKGEKGRIHYGIELGKNLLTVRGSSAHLVAEVEGDEKFGEKVLKSFLRGFCYDHQPRNDGKFECVSVGGGEITLDVQVIVCNR